MYCVAQIMNQSITSEFISWLDDQLAMRGWSDNELARRAKISHPVLSKARNGVQPVGWSSCVKIAEALDLPPVLVLQRAGLLPPETEMSDEEKEITFLFSQLPPERQQDVLKMVRALLQK